jgi:monoamine oxidase
MADETIEAVGTIENLTSRLPLSFFHSFLGRSNINPSDHYWELEGGSWRLPYAFLSFLRDEIVMGRRLVQMEYWHPERDCSACRHVGPNGPAVWLKTVDEQSDEDRGGGTPSTPVFQEFTGDVAIITIPFSSLRHVSVDPLFSYKKGRAIIEMHYDSATKVLLEFSKRWWEFTEDDWKNEMNAIREGLYDEYRREGQGGGAALLGADPAVDETRISAREKAFYTELRQQKAPEREATRVLGGGSVTDNPNRFMYYPSHPVPGSKGGVVLASYSWADDAARWDSMSNDERYAFALRGLQSLHGRRIELFFTGRGQTQSWLRNRYAFGEAAVFTPGQLTQFHLDIPTPEGPVHFAGEHTSLKHAWVEGAIESAIRAALEVNGQEEQS